jgi:hypothetical protein
MRHPGSFWASNGSGSWHPETIAGIGSAFFSPTMILNGNTVDVRERAGRADSLLGGQRQHNLAGRNGGAQRQPRIAARLRRSVRSASGTSTVKNWTI